MDKKKKESNETNYDGEEGHCFKPLYKAIRGGSCAPDGPYQQRVSVLSWPVLGRVTATVKDSLWSVMPTPNADGTRRGTPSHELPTQPRVSKYFKSSADLRVKKMGRTHSVLLCLIDSFFRRGRKWHSFEIGRNRSWLRLELALIFWKMEKRIFSDETRLMKIRFHRSISIRGLWNFLKIIRNLFQKSIYRIKISLFGLFSIRIPVVSYIKHRLKVMEDGEREELMKFSS